MRKRDKTKTTPAQQYSKMSILGVGVLGILRSLGILGGKIKNEIVPAQQYSKMSNGRLFGKTTPAQQYSGNSKLAVCLTGRTSQTRPTERQRAPAQQYSKMSILGVGVLGILRSLGILGWKTKNETVPAQQYSKMSNGRLSGKTTLAQRDSEISILKTSPYRTLDLKKCPAQQYSGMPNLEVESENRPAQQYSGMANLKTCPFCPSCPSVADCCVYCNRYKNICLLQKVSKSFKKIHNLVGFDVAEIKIQDIIIKMNDKCLISKHLNLYFYINIKVLI